ncbi:MAG: hypothetical protein ACYC2E_17320, partial [Sulfuricella sp.]
RIFSLDITDDHIAASIPVGKVKNAAVSTKRNVVFMHLFNMSISCQFITSAFEDSGEGFMARDNPDLFLLWRARQPDADQFSRPFYGYRL